MACGIGIGIDVSKDKVDVASSDGAVHRTVWRTPAALRTLAEDLAEGSPHLVVDEAPDIDALVGRVAEVQEVVAELDTFKGEGRVTAATLAVTLPELGRLNRREAAALAGVAHFNRDSGKKVGKRFIHGGRAAARKALYMAALAAIRHDSPPMRAQYKRLRSKGKPARAISPERPQGATRESSPSSPACAGC